MNTKKTQIMGILNITPDSFSDGGKYIRITPALKRVEQMINEGADSIDIGGESTRPGAELITIEEELKRVIPIIQRIKQKFPTLILSIDTWKHEVAEQALKNGCTIINSLGGFSFDEKLAAVAAHHRAQIIIYHIKGHPKNHAKRENILQKYR